MRACLQCLVVVALMMLVGCGKTAYQPAKSSRVAATSKGYVRDGITYPHGLGGGLVEALHDSPRAQVEARKARGFMVAGFLCAGGGLALEALGVGMMVAGSERDEATGRGQLNTLGTVGAGIALGGIVTALVGAALATHAAAHATDAVNIHNDSVEATPPQP
jgi:hypothetical protein